MTDEKRSKPEDSGSPQERLPDELRADLAGLFGGPADVPDRVDKAVSDAARARLEGIRAAADSQPEPIAGRIGDPPTKTTPSPFDGKRWWLGPAVGAAVAACLMFAFVFLMPEADRSYEQAAMSAKPNALAESDTKKNGYSNGGLADAEQQSAITERLDAAADVDDRLALRGMDETAAEGRFRSLDATMDRRQAGSASSSNLRKQSRDLDADPANAPQALAELGRPAPSAKPAPARSAPAADQYQQKLEQRVADSPRRGAQPIEDHQVAELKEDASRESNWGMVRAEPEVEVAEAQRPAAPAAAAPADSAAEADVFADEVVADLPTSTGDVADAERRENEEISQLAQAGSNAPAQLGGATRVAVQPGSPVDAPVESLAEGSAAASAAGSGVSGKRAAAPSTKVVAEHAGKDKDADDGPKLIQADVDESGVTDIADVIALAQQFITPGQAGNMRWDMTGDGRIDDLDMLAVARVATAHMAEMHEKQRDSNSNEDPAVTGQMLTNVKGKSLWFSISVPVSADQQLVATQFTINPGENGQVAEVVTLASNSLNRVVVDKPLPVTGEVHVAVYTSQARLLGHLQAADKQGGQNADLASDVALPMSIMFVQIKPGDVVFRPGDLVRSSALCVFSDMSVRRVQPQVQRRYIDVTTQGQVDANPAASMQERE